MFLGEKSTSIESTNFFASDFGLYFECRGILFAKQVKSWVLLASKVKVN